MLADAQSTGSACDGSAPPKTPIFKHQPCHSVHERVHMIHGGSSLLSKNMFSILPSLLLPFLDLYTHQANCLNAVGLRTIRTSGVICDSNRCLAVFKIPKSEHVALLGKSLTQSLYTFARRREWCINCPNESPQLNKKPHRLCKAGSAAQPRDSSRRAL